MAKVGLFSHIIEFYEVETSKGLRGELKKERGKLVGRAMAMVTDLDWIAKEEGGNRNKAFSKGIEIETYLKELPAICEVVFKGKGYRIDAIQREGIFMKLRAYET